MAMCQKQRQELNILRDTIDGELNRIAVTDDVNEIDSMVEYLTRNIQKYATKNKNRIQGIYEPEHIKGGNLKL